MTKYPKIGGGEVVELKKGAMLSYACCECGVVHTLTIGDIDDAHSLSFGANYRATAQLRARDYGYLQQGAIKGFHMVRVKK